MSLSFRQRLDPPSLDSCDPLRGPSSATKDAPSTKPCGGQPLRTCSSIDSRHQLVLDVPSPFEIPQGSKMSAGTQVSESTTGFHNKEVDITEIKKTVPGLGPLLCECNCTCRIARSRIQCMAHEPGMRPCCCRSCGPYGGRGCAIELTLIGQGFDRMKRGRDPEDEREPFYCEDCRDVNHLMLRRAAVKRGREECEAGATRLNRDKVKTLRQ